MTINTSSAAFFDAKYADKDDPWNFATNRYEISRYETILKHVNPELHGRVFEPGCSIGVLTQLLARRVKSVHATDLSELAVMRAKRRCADLANASFEVGGIAPPDVEEYDLIVLSEVGYYLDASELWWTAGEVAARVAPKGRIIAAHWLGTSPDHVLNGRDVHYVLASVLTGWLTGWFHAHHSVHPDCGRDGFILDVWDKS
jgi:2-polyprenyl-3-methyl-5-hydroxy-6-metoxy-1,4-benzoquinol methylase